MELQILRLLMPPAHWVANAMEELGERASVLFDGINTGADWMLHINRLGILEYSRRRFPQAFATLDGGDKRIMLSFLDPEPLSNTCSLLGTDLVRPLLRNGPPTALWFLPLPEAFVDHVPIVGKFPPVRDDEFSEFGLRKNEDRVAFLRDTLGKTSKYDTPVVEEHDGARETDERWFFVNGILTSRALARRNAENLRHLLGKPFITIHNPTEGLAGDLLESALQKFTNVNTEPVALTLVEIARALADPGVSKVRVVAHSQGTIIMGDVLDLIYFALDPAKKRHLVKTNMNTEDFDAFLRVSHARISSDEIRGALEPLRGRDDLVSNKLELYMFANAASRMCYLNEEKRLPHIESFANEHDLVARLGCLAEDTFHEEDLLRIDGPVFMRRGVYGHLLNAHYLSGNLHSDYELLPDAGDYPPRRSLRDRVVANPCARNPKHTKVSPSTTSRFLEMVRQHSIS